MRDTSANTNQSVDDGTDILGYRVYAETLWARIVAALDKDQLNPEKELGDDPLVVGIFGEWGAGKSKLLSLIRERAKKDCEERIQSGEGGSANNPITVPVFFQPWKYEHEDHLLVPMLLHILAALEETLKKTETLTGRAVGVLWRVLDTAISGVKQVTGAATHVLKKIDPTSAGILSVAEALVGMLPKDRKKTITPRQFSFKDDGRSYYEMHHILAKITRPGKYSEIADQSVQDKDLAVNFVIFIDDLDRCLPEKAVATLELIKTIFNLESFAFVLALDEEVVERGIGHRYRDYALANKKPEMPITGFEYLEKIVHLPFRLPALTRNQALQFLAQYERNLLAQKKPRHVNIDAWLAQRTWFAGRTCELSVHEVLEINNKADSVTGFEYKKSRQSTKQYRFNLARLVVNVFDAFVPRKLIRVVELYHQILDVLEETKDDGDVARITLLGMGQRFDPRLVIAFVLLQLFQPDLYRCLRRTRVGFDELRDAFTKGEIHAQVADVDLWAWAISRGRDAAAQGKELPPSNLRSAVIALRSRDIQARYTAQQIFLPLVERLVEHRSIQRHVFDPLKLFANLANFGEQTPALPVHHSRDYFGLLSAALPDAVDALDRLAVFDAPSLDSSAPASQASAQASGSVLSAVADRRKRQNADPALLFAALTSTSSREQEAMAATAGLKEGVVLESGNAVQLHEQLSRWLGGDAVEPQKNELRQRLLQGLRYLAPYIAREEGARFWELVRDTQGYAPGSGEIGAEAFKDKETIVRRELWADVRSALGQDPRFDAARFFLLKERYNEHDESQEPIPGFVRIPAGQYTLGAQGKGFEDNPPYDAKIESDYFIARTLTTVDQYACFIDDKGYDNEGLWGKLGQPREWLAQRAYGSRPVTRLTWLQAWAYCRWLQAKLCGKDDILKNGKILLPTEMQWERAARALNKDQCDARQYPWGGSDSVDVHLHANIGSTGIDHASVVGLFQPNLLGIVDLAGNGWEWQGNLYLPKGDATQGESIIEDVDSPETYKKLEKSSSPALRGGAWFGTAEDARASIRFMYRPNLWDSNVGFRVVLSLA